jgi:hypothetical protein
MSICRSTPSIRVPQTFKCKRNITCNSRVWSVQVKSSFHPLKYLFPFLQYMNYFTWNYDDWRKKETNLIENGQRTNNSPVAVCLCSFGTGLFFINIQSNLFLFSIITVTTILVCINGLWKWSRKALLFVGWHWAYGGVLGHVGASKTTYVHKELM